MKLAKRFSKLFKQLREAAAKHRRTLTRQEKMNVLYVLMTLVSELRSI